MARKKLGEMLVDANLLRPEELQRALVEQQRWGGPLGQILVDKEMISEDILVKALSKQLNIPVANVEVAPIARRILALIPDDLADQHSLIPFQQEGRFLDVAMADPLNLGILDEIRIRTQLNVRPHLAGPAAIRRAINKNYGMGVSRGADPGGRRRGDSLSVDFGDSGARDALADMRDAEIASLQKRMARLEGLVTREQDVIRKLLGLLVSKNVATRDEILAAIK